MPPVSASSSNNLKVENGGSSIISNYKENTHLVDLSQQNLKDIPKDVLLFKKLRIIILNNNYLTNGNIFKTDLPMLKKIDLNINNLKSFPIPKCLDKLRELILSNNLIDEFPLWLIENKRFFLECLDLSNNPLFSKVESIRLPSHYHEMRNILYLNLSNTEMSCRHLPILRYFSTLKCLDISSYSLKYSNSIFNIPHDIFPSKLEILLMRNVGLSSFPNLYLEYLLVLDLSNNILTFIPDFLTFYNLEKLILRKCKLCFLPKTFGCYKSLVYLDLSHNDISELPQSITECTKLKYLDLYDNMLPFYPEELDQLKIEKLDLSKNYHQLPQMCGRKNYSEMESELRKISDSMRETGPKEPEEDEDYDQYSSSSTDSFYSNSDPQPLIETVKEESEQEIWGDQNNETANDAFDPSIPMEETEECQIYTDKTIENELKDCVVTCPGEILTSEFFYHPGESRYQRSFYNSYKTVPVLRTFPVEEKQFDNA